MVLLYLCRRRTKFLELTGVAPLLILTVGTFLRCFLPIDVPLFTRVIQSDRVVSNVNSVLKIPIGNTAFTVMTVLELIWIIGSVAFFLRYLYRVTRLHFRLRRYLPEEDTEIALAAERVAKEINAPVPRVIQTNIVATPTICGFFKPTVLLPTLSYSEVDLRYIFLHELTHWKEHDLLVKLLIEIFSDVFWWNPCCLLLKHDLSRTVDIRCDQAVTRDFDAEERKLYGRVLYHVLDQRINTPRFFIPYSIAEFASKNKDIQQRVELITNSSVTKNSQRFFSGLLLICMVGVLIFSYSFVIQSYYDVPESEYTPQGYIEFSSEGSFLVRETNGEYSLYIDGQKTTIPADSAEQLLADGFILKNDYKGG